MALITLAEAKTILRKDDQTDDDTLATLLAYAKDDLVEYLNNHFQSKIITYYASSIAFVSGDPDTITDSDEQFVLEGFTAGDYAIEYAHDNTGIHEVASVTAGTLTLSSSNNLVDMNPDDDNHPIGGVRISRVVWPNALKMVVAKMAWHLYMESRPEDKIGGSQDGSSWQSSVTLMSGAYPKRILAMANKWKRPRFV